MYMTNVSLNNLKEKEEDEEEGKRHCQLSCWLATILLPVMRQLEGKTEK